MTKIALALALTLGTATTVLAAPKNSNPTNGVHSSNPANDVYDIRGWYVGSDPDATIRSMLAHDVGSD